MTDFRGGHLVFGGQALDGSYLADAWLIDHEGAPAAGPDTDAGATGRAGAELVTDETGDRVLLFGGRDGDGTFAELWELTAPVTRGPVLYHGPSPTPAGPRHRAAARS